MTMREMIQKLIILTILILKDFNQVNNIKKILWMKIINLKDRKLKLTIQGAIPFILNKDQWQRNISRNLNQRIQETKR